MHTLSITADEYFRIRSGIASFLIVDESLDMLIAEPIILQCSEPNVQGEQLASIEASVNCIVTDKNVAGLKKGYTVISVSVIRLLTPEVLANDK